MNNEAGNLLLEGLQENQGKIEAKKVMNGRVNTMGKKKSLAGIIGVGAGGSNLAHLLTAEGYQTAALNTTVADMTGIDVNIKLALTGLNGSGKDRQFASEEFKKSYKNFFTHEQILDLINSNNLIFVSATAGGGTGTILAIMVAGFIKDEYPTKTVVVVGLLGNLKEDKISQQNMREFLSDMENKIPNCPYMLFDNNRVVDKIGDGVYDTVNHEAADAIRLLSKEFWIDNTRSNIDGRDYARLMSYGGLMSVTSINNLDISVSDSTILLEPKVVAAMQQSTAIVTNNPEAYGIFMNVNSEVYNSIDTTFDAIQNIKGRPQSGLVFKQLQNTSGFGPQFAIIAVGLAAPAERFKMIEKRIEEYSKVLDKTRLPSVNRAESVKLAGDPHGATSGNGSGFMNNF